jgi:hypothetical protein
MRDSDDFTNASFVSKFSMSTSSPRVDGSNVCDAKGNIYGTNGRSISFFTPSGTLHTSPILTGTNTTISQICLVKEGAGTDTAQIAGVIEGPQSELVTGGASDRYSAALIMLDTQSMQGYAAPVVTDQYSKGTSHYLWSDHPVMVTSGTIRYAVTTMDNATSYPANVSGCYVYSYSITDFVEA